MGENKKIEKISNRYKKEDINYVLDFYEKNKNTMSLLQVAKKFDLNYITIFRWAKGGRVKSEETAKKDSHRAKERYSKLGQITINIEIDIYEKFIAKCDEENVTQAGILREYIETYIGKKESDFE